MIPKLFEIPAEFKQIWMFIALLCIFQGGYIFLCHQFALELQVLDLKLETRVLIRSIFYIIAIINFPLTNLIRHVLLRLNQIMLSNKTALQRYTTTVVISLSFMAIIGTFGILMFILGDDFNSLYIFSVLALFGFFLQRPKFSEYTTIITALNSR